jgi:hypothetical protein
MRVASHMVGTIAYNRSLQIVDEHLALKGTVPDDDVKKYWHYTKRDVVSRCWAVIFSHPLHGI